MAYFVFVRPSNTETSAQQLHPAELAMVMWRLAAILLYLNLI